MKFPHGKWAILMKEGGFNLDCLETSNILSFETPLQFSEHFLADAAIEGSYLAESAEEMRNAYKENRLPSLEALREYFFIFLADQAGGKKEWERRISLAEEWIDFLDKEISRLGLSESEQRRSEEVISEAMSRLVEIRGEKLNENSREIKFR